MEQEIERGPQQKKIWTAVYLATVALFLCAIAAFYQPFYGFSTLLGFGDHFSGNEIAGLHAYVAPNSGGNDGQFYAKISLDPLLRSPNIKTEVDDPQYRSRRILPSWTAWLLGLGRPALVLQVFALLNVLCWLATAGILIRWFPPRDFNNYLRWAGVLFSSGMLMSVRCSFVDGPALMFIALAMAFLEQGRYNRACATLMFGALARETVVLALFALFDPARHSPRDLGKFTLRAAWICLPLACWVIYVKLALARLGPEPHFYFFAFPFAGIWHNWRDLVSGLFAGHLSYIRPFLALLALSVQAAFILLKPNCRDPWWRLGCAFTVLVLVLGDPSMWGAGLPFTRHALPMTLAFNILVPRGRRWLPLLLAGNLSLVYAPMIVPSVPQDMAFVSGPESTLASQDEHSVALQFDAAWSDVHRRLVGSDAWRTGSGTLGVTLANPRTFAINAAVHLLVNCAGTHRMTLEWDGREVWNGEIKPQRSEIFITGLRLNPGNNRLVFNEESAGPPAGAGAPLPIFYLRDLRIILSGPEAAPAPGRAR